MQNPTGVVYGHLDKCIAFFQSKGYLGSGKELSRVDFRASDLKI